MIGDVLMHLSRVINPVPLPRPAASLIRLGCRRLPGGIQRAGLESALTRLFQRPLAARELDFLDGRVLCVEISDLDWRWPLTLAGGTLCCLPRHAAATTTIRAPARVFAALAMRRSDPDTLFFQRELTIEGDTELGLAGKNFLDSLEWDRLWQEPGQLLARLWRCEPLL